MIDRPARDKVLRLLTAYMNGKRTLHSVDLAIFDLEQTTDDELIALAGQIAWFCGDRIDPEKRFEGDRNVWNLLCRLKLLLASDAEVKACKVKDRHPIQPVALLSCLVLLPLMLYLGMLQNGLLFWPYMALCGCWTYFLDKKHIQVIERFNREEIHASRLPFNSFGEILAVRRSVPDFRKPSFPSGLPEHLPDREESIRPFRLACQCLFFGFIFLLLWFGPLLGLVSRDERTRYEFDV